MIVLVYLLLLAFAGCTPQALLGGGVPSQRTENQGSLTNRLNTVTIVDNALLGGPGKLDRVSVESSSSHRTPTGTLEVWAVLRNMTDYPMQIEGRTQFFDRDQVPLAAPTSWTRVHLPANSTATYRGLSTHADEVGYYTVEIREGR